MSELTNIPLGKSNIYTDKYDPSLLFAICRDGNRISIGIDVKDLPFRGVDIWNGFDFTWLDANHIPQFGVLTIFVPSESSNLIESKSLKLYLFSFANTVFNSRVQIVQTLEQDLTAVAGQHVSVALETNPASFAATLGGFVGESLDKLDIISTEKSVNPELLKINPAVIVQEQLCSDLLKSNCLVTGNPDWGSVRITYTGPKIDHESLLQYIISYRNHQGFHEQCIEHIYVDILNLCKPTKLVVEGRYTRRGGLDINPIRTNADLALNNSRLFRQ